MDAETVPPSLVKALQHDLRAPARHIKGFAEIVAESLAAGDLDDAREQLARVVQGAQELDHRIERLATWARFASSSPVLAPVDLAQLVSAGVTSSAMRIKPRMAGPQAGCVNADAVWLQQALQELVSNAIKAVASVEHPDIAISSEVASGQACLRVVDNGIGLSATGAQGLVTFFGRGHPARLFPGAGMGLVICERIARAHGGRILLGTPSVSAGGDAASAGGCAVSLVWPC